MTQDEAWVKFNELMPGAEATLVESEWFRVRGVVLPKCAPDKMTAIDWATFIEAAPAHITPF